MGCDIHIYPEYSSFRSGAKDYWQNFATNMNPGRDYELFGALAGIRGFPGPIVPIRGLPDDLAMMTKWDNTIWVSETKPDTENHCSRENAESWVKTGGSSWIDDTKDAVTHPDHHSHTWLTVEEFRAAIALVGRDVEMTYYALLAALDEIEKRGGKTRVVMWFDN